MASTARLAIILAALLVGIVLAVDHSVFKTCSQSSFCRRCRSLQPGTSTFQVVDNTLSTTNGGTTAVVDLLNSANGQLFVLSVQALQSNTFRVQIDEKTPLRTRYRIEDALQADPQTAVLAAVANADGTISITVSGTTNRVVITKQPFRIDFYVDNVLTVTANGRGLMRFEHYRVKPSAGTVPGNSIEENDPDSWEETFNGFLDSKPFGPEAIAMDFGFPEAKVLFGIPAHADSLSLKATTGANVDPYRLYNLDVAFHEVDSGMSLYGAVPVLYGHGSRRTAGVFWHNSAETWIDIYNATGSSAPLAANFMTESGIVDAFVMLGPRPVDTFRQYTTLTGVVPLPQQYTLAYHQCRWNYDNETDVMEVAANFDRYDIPLDTMWLDIEYTDQKKYYTWDPVTFAHPLQMIANLSASGRHLHVIVDIHLMHSDDYPVNVDCINMNLYTKDKDGNDFVGDCWPGASGYPDVFTSAARDYMASRYSVANFPGTTEDVMIWNDMNEPSVFDGPEKTMPKTNVHTSQHWEHRNLHNQFGHMQLRSTHAGLMARGQNVLRPFILTRSHFAGSQRYAMIWTGDNTADWAYLQVSLKMCLSEAVAGFSFCGADVGGFFGHPDGELYARWYQAAAWTPFYRSHANMGTPRREPWLYDVDTRLRIRRAVKRRYVYLPVWYTLFYEHERFGAPVMRPLLTEFPGEEAAFAIDHQFMLGGVLLVHPVMTAGLQTARVYLPQAMWYDIDDYALYNGTAAFREFAVDMDKTFVYQRGGTILAQRRTERKASVYMVGDPYTLVVCMNATAAASGSVYEDDGRSFEYRSSRYVYARLVYSNGTLSSQRIDRDAQYDTTSEVERIVLAGVDGMKLQTATIDAGTSMGDYEVVQTGNTFVVEGLKLRLNEEWSVRFSGAAELRAFAMLLVLPLLAMLTHSW